MSSLNGHTGSSVFNKLNYLQYCEGNQRTALAYLIAILSPQKLLQEAFRDIIAMTPHNNLCI